MAFATLEMQTSMSTPNWHTGHPQTWCHFPMGEVTFGEGIWVFKYWHFWNIFMTYSTRGAERSGKCQRSCETVLGIAAHLLGGKTWRWRAGQAAERFSCKWLCCPQ